MRVHLVMTLNQLLDGQHGKSVGWLFEKVSNSLLLTDIPTTKRNQDKNYSKMVDCTDQSSTLYEAASVRNCS